MNKPREHTHFPFTPGPFEFRPPMLNPWLIRLVQAFIPGYLKSFGIQKIEIPETELAKLQALGDERVILIANHPNNEPVLMFHLSGKLGRNFYYMTAKELFTVSWLQGYILQRVGCYSIVRGTTDTPAFRMTRRIIREGKNWLVIFPEGTHHNHSDLVLPFQGGVTQLAFWGLEDISKDDPPPVYMVPVAVRYHYTQDMSEEIRTVLTRLESNLGIPAVAGDAGYLSRLTHISDKLLAENESAYRVRPDPGDSIQMRLDRMLEVMLRRVAAGLGMDPPKPGQPMRDRIRVLFNALDAVRPGSDDESSPYARRVQQREERLARRLYRELDRIMAVVALSGTYIRDCPTVERLLDVLGRLEREVTGRERFYKPQRALVKVGEPVNIAGYYQRYRKQRQETVNEVTLELENAVRRLLNETSDCMTPIDLD